MGIDDYIMPAVARIEDDYINRDSHRSFGNSILPGNAGPLSPEPSYYASQQVHTYDPHPGESDAVEPAYQPYQAEMPPPMRENPFDPPAPVPFEHDSSVVGYDGCRMTQSLFDWSMRNVMERQTSGAGGWVRPEEEIVPIPPLEILIETLLPPERLDPEVR